MLIDILILHSNKLRNFNLRVSYISRILNFVTFSKSRKSRNLVLAKFSENKVVDSKGNIKNETADMQKSINLDLRIFTLSCTYENFSVLVIACRILWQKRKEKNLVCVLNGVHTSNYL